MQGSFLSSNAVDPLLQPAHLKSPLVLEGMGIADAARAVLDAVGKPLACMEISRLAIECGYAAGQNIERVRSHFSAVISKDLKNADSQFWQVGRGQIGLAKWRQISSGNADGSGSGAGSSYSGSPISPSRNKIHRSSHVFTFIPKRNIQADEAQIETDDQGRPI